MALLIPEPVSLRVIELQNQMERLYRSKHALKSPPHITLQRPFKWAESDEARIVESFKGFFARQASQTAQLKNFGHFSNRTIFIGVEPNEGIDELYTRLRFHVLEELRFLSKMVSDLPINPHVTIGNRDLVPTFRAAWPDFRKREFDAEVDFNSAHLLKHNGEHWDVVAEFPLGA